MTPFQYFAHKIHDRFDALSAHELFVTSEDSNAVWEQYLAAFPEGSNPIYKTHTEHDCSCCKQFIRNIGNVVAIIDGKIESVWGVTGLSYPYDTVAASLDAFVKGNPITDVFRVSEQSYGAKSTRQLLPETGEVKTWSHFHGKIASRHFTQEVGTVRGKYRSALQVFKRGLHELKDEALQTVEELIEAKALYRGEEHLPAIHAFRQAKEQFELVGAEQARELFAWANAGLPAARFRNTVIGTLVDDLSSGVEIEKAVRAFEEKVAPGNYKHPTAPITPRMVEDAMKAIGWLGLESALDRRFARIGDVSVNNVLWVDNSVKPLMKGGVKGLLMAAATAPAASKDKGEDIGIEDFMSRILPTASSISMLVKSSHTGNLVSLTAPVHADPGHLFKWNNDFGWSYNGNVADSIKERVKKAGGSVTGDLCCRLAWEYRDDLDFHMVEPNGDHIYYGQHRRSQSSNGGVLDLDANGVDGLRDDPAENIVYADRRQMREGIYQLSVKNFSRRSDKEGFEVEIEFDGKIHRIAYAKALRGGETMEIAHIKYSKAAGFEIIKSLPASTASRQVWGIPTETLVKVNTVMFSPNYWDGNAVGNKHWFFMLDGCKADEPVRGIYNEFLSNDLNSHGRVFEVLGAKTKCPVAEEQLSGLGFSSTKADTVTVQVKGDKLRKTFNIHF